MNDPTVAVIGLGRIGLPIALCLANKGIKVYGFDIDEEVINALRRGQEPFYEPHLYEYLVSTLNTNFQVDLFTDETLAKLKDVTHVIIALGISIDEEMNIRSEAFFKVIETIARGDLLKGKCLVIRTTLPLGFSRKIVEFIHKVSGLREGVDYYYAYVPERLVEGKAIEEEESLPKIIGVYNDEAYLRTVQLFKKFRCKCIKVTPEEAELIKLIDNAWRCTIFAFANNLALLAEAIGLDIVKTIRIANEDYPRNSIPLPGPVSGYCLTKDPYLLEASIPKGSHIMSIPNLWFIARRINDYVIEYLVNKALNYIDKLKHMNVNTKTIKILVLGLAYKADIDDYRNSHSITFIRMLMNKLKQNQSLSYVELHVHDPYIDKHRYTRIPPDIRNSAYVANELDPEILRQYNVIIILTPHSMYVDLMTKAINSICRMESSNPGMLIIIDAYATLKEVIENAIKSTCRSNLIYSALGVELKNVRT